MSPSDLVDNKPLPLSKEDQILFMQIVGLDHDRSYRDPSQSGLNLYFSCYQYGLVSISYAASYLSHFYGSNNSSSSSIFPSHYQVPEQYKVLKLHFNGQSGFD
jgi:hypothetical protein